MLLLVPWQACFEQLHESGALRIGQFHFGSFLLADQIVDRIAIDTDKVCLLQLLLQLAHDMRIQLTVQQHHAVAFVGCTFHVAVLSMLVRSIEIHHLSVLVRLYTFDERSVFVERVLVSVHIGEKEELGCTLIELLIRQHTVFDEELQTIPFLLECGAVVFENFFQTVCHLLGDMRRDLLHIGIALQIGARYVEGNIRRIDDPVQEGEEVRHDTLYFIGDVNLIAVELNLVALQIQVVFDLREIEDTCQIERIVHIEVDPKERLFGHGIERTVKFLIVFVLEVGRLFGPGRMCVVDLIVLVRILHLAVFPFLLLAENDRHSKELTVFAEETLYLFFFEELAILLS